MYFRYNSEDYNGKIINDGRHDHDDDYEEFFKKMPYYSNQIPYLPQMYYPMMYSYPMMWGMQKRDEEDVKDLKSEKHSHDYRCKDCEEDGNFKTMMDMTMNEDHIPVCEDDEYSKPVMNIPMNQNQIPMYGDEEEDVEDLKSKNHDQDYRCKGYENARHFKPMINMTIYGNNNMPVSDEDLKCMYPKIYIRIYPMVKYHCDMMESKYGAMYCPDKNEMNHICKEVCDKYEEHYRDDYDEDNRNDDSEEMRQRRRRFSRRGIGDLFRILFIRDLLGRRRRRRRRMFHHGY